MNDSCLLALYMNSRRIFIFKGKGGYLVQREWFRFLGDKGIYEGIDWMYINLNSKVFASRYARCQSLLCYR